MSDSVVHDVSKMKVVELRKELKTRGLSYAGDKAELIARLQASLSEETQEEHGDITLDSDEIDSDGVLDEDDKINNDNDVLDEVAVDSVNEELALSDQPHNAKPTNSRDEKLFKTLKRKLISSEESKVINTEKLEHKESATKKIVLNRAVSVTTVSTKSDSEKSEIDADKSQCASSSSKVKISASLDSKARLEQRAKRFGLPVNMTDDERKEARKQRFSQNTNESYVLNKPSVCSTDNLDKLKKRAERFGQSVSKFMTDIENKEKLEKRRAKFGTVK